MTYDCKTIQTQFYLGCSIITENDIKYFVRGLERCYELREFRQVFDAAVNWILSRNNPLKDLNAN